MDRKRSCLGLGSEITEIAESKAELSGIPDSKIIQYPLIFTPPPTKLINYVFSRFLLDGGFRFAFSVPGCNFSVEIEEYGKPHQTMFFFDLIFEDAFTLIHVEIPSADGRIQSLHPQLCYEFPEGTDTSQYKSAFANFLSEFQEEGTYSWIFRKLWFSSRNQRDRKPISVTLRIKGRSKEEREKRGICLPFNDLLNACPISRKSPIRFSHGPNLSPEFRHGHIELHLYLFMLDDLDHRTVVQVEQVETHTRFEELAQMVFLKHGWYVFEFRDRFSNWTFEHENEFRKAISECIFEHHGPLSIACDARMFDSMLDRRYVLRTYCKLSP